jgi:Uma2 family endonuclease
MAPQPIPHPSFDDWLSAERASHETRTEYVAGEVFAMAGGSEEHSLIVANVVGELRTQLKGKPCRVYPSHMKVRMAAADAGTYPDAMVICGERHFHDDRRDVVTNPHLLVEVLSDSTEAYDRGRKFAHYRRLDSLQAYLLIAQDRVAVDCDAKARALVDALRQLHRDGRTDPFWEYFQAKLDGDLALDELTLQLRARPAFCRDRHWHIDRVDTGATLSVAAHEFLVFETTLATRRPMVGCATACSTSPTHSFSPLTSCAGRSASRTSASIARHRYRHRVRTFGAERAEPAARQDACRRDRREVSAGAPRALCSLDGSGAKCLRTRGPGKTIRPRMNANDSRWLGQ